MADKGIIFSAAMVRALLDGRKTQTRRLLPQPLAEITSAGVYSNSVEGVTDRWTWLSGDPKDCDTWGAGDDFKTGYCPGQRLYVREAWHVRGQYSDVVEVGYRASENRGHTEYVEQWPVASAVPGKAKPGRPAPKWPEFPKYGPSIHMPRWASRMWLAVTDVRVQRLQECSGRDAIAEGIDGFACIGGNAWRDYAGGDGFNVRDRGDPAKRSYATLWNSLHTAKGERWEDNPWVVAVSFDVNLGNIDAERDIAAQGEGQ